MEEVAAGYGPDSTSVMKNVTEEFENARGLSCDLIVELAARRSDWSFAGPPWERAQPPLPISAVPAATIRSRLSRRRPLGP